MKRRRGRASSVPGIVAGDLDSFGLPDLSALGEGPLPPLVAEVVERAGSDYRRWAEQVASTGYCSRPIRLRGRVEQVDRATGEIRTVYTTTGEPNDELLVSCGTRRASVCRSCSAWYQGDAFHLVAAGLRGGKGVPESVASHPRVFVTFTAPSFGAVHAHRERNGRVLPCRPRDRKKTCPHGVPLGCSVRHKVGDARIGQPLCEGCFDYRGQVLWNALAPALWKRTCIQLPRELARLAGMSQRIFSRGVKVRFAKVAEYQHRGAIHFHAIVRLDAAPPADDPDAVAAPPAGMTVELLEEGLRAARASARISLPELEVLALADNSVGWGEEMDVRTLLGEAGELSAEVVAAYISKYSTKFSEGLGLPQQPIECRDAIDALEVSEHVRRLVLTAWELGFRGPVQDLKLADHAHGLGFGGHFLTKSRMYSTTMKALRRTRREFRRLHRQGNGAVVLDAWGRPEDEGLAEVRNLWFYAGWGFHTAGEAYLASSAAARAREERRVAREELENKQAA